jgi:hypothetical protein
METHSCGCTSYRGCKVKLKWQNNILFQGEDGHWGRIVSWDKGCCLPQVVFAISVKREVLVLDSTTPVTNTLRILQWTLQTTEMM